MKQLLHALVLALVACDSPNNPPKPIESASDAASSSDDTSSNSGEAESSSGGESTGVDASVDVDQLVTPASQTSSNLCCPIYNGVQVDSLCWPDLDGVPNCQNDPDFPVGGAISGWKVTTCRNCVTGDDPNSTWVLNGAWGYECQGFADVRFEGYVDSDCNDTNNTNADGGSCEDDSVPGNSCPTNPNAASTNVHDGGTALMCCDVGSPTICTPAGPGETSCSAAYPTLAWSTNWQLAAADGTVMGGTAAQQWAGAIDCNAPTYNPPGGITSCRRTRYVTSNAITDALTGDLL